MKSYSLSTDGMRKMRYKMLLQASYISGSIFLSILAIVSLFLNMGTFVTHFLFPSLVVLLISLWVGFELTRREMKRYNKYEIEMDVNEIQIIGNLGKRSTVVRKSILQILDVDGQGIEIMSSDPRSSVFIPKELNDYEYFVKDLKEWTQLDIKRRLSIWGILGAAFTILLALSFFVAITAYIPAALKFVRHILLFLFWSTFVGSQLMVGEALFGMNVSIPRKQKPILYWIVIGIELVPYYWICNIDLNGAFSLNLTTMIAVSILTTIWTTILVIFVANGMRQMRVDR